MKLTKQNLIPAFLGLTLIAANLKAGSADDANMINDAQRIEQKSDDLLNLEYRLLIKELNPAQVAELSQLEREWIDYRDHAVAGPEVTRAELPDLAKANLKTSLTLERIRFLKLYSGKNVSPTLEGNYDDFAGGIMKISSEGKGKYSMDLSTVRGHSASNGSIVGTFSLDKKNKARLVAGEDEECVLQIRRDRNRIYIESESAGCESFHGMQARFPGRYFKTDIKK